MNIAKLARDPRAMKALTGLSYTEFTNLVSKFESAMRFLRQNKPGRKRKVGGGQKGKLPSVEEKLFFVLFYLKTYPTFDVLSFLVDINRGRCNKGIQFYLKVLKKTLGKEIVLPKRKIRSVEEFFTLFPSTEDIFLDGTERRIQRPRNKKRQNKFYSGKKKTNTRKNIVMSDEDKNILFISPTKSGRRHDKRVADKSGLNKVIPDSVGVWIDTGFQGFVHPNIVQPKKATKNRPLTDEEKQENHIIAHFRVKAEHALAGIKRFRATTDVFRNKIGVMDDLVIELAAGLWNYHLRYAS